MKRESKNGKNVVSPRVYQRMRFRIQQLLYTPDESGEDRRSGKFSVSRKDGTSVDPREMLSAACLALFVESCSLAVSSS